MAQFKNGTFVPMYENSPIVCVNAGTKVSSNGIWNAANDDPLTYPLPLTLLQLILMVLISRTVHYLLRPLKQPRIVANIIAGVILGPSVLGRNEAFSKMVFPIGHFNRLNTLPAFGVIFYMFLFGVKIDPTVITWSGKRTVTIGIIGMILPLVLVASSSYMLSKIISVDIVTGPFLIFLPISISISSFPVLAEILTELNLLNSDLGRLALHCSMINDLFCWITMVLFVVTNQTLNGGFLKGAETLAAVVGMLLFIFFVFRPWTKWIIQRTPTSGRVGEAHIASILLCVLVISFISDCIGATYVDGPFFLGIALPSGPPLGSAIVERVETMVSELFMPFAFIAFGLYTDLTAITDWKTWRVLQSVLFLGYISKLVGTMVPAVYCKMPVRNAFLLGLIMNFRGLVEMLTFINWRYGQLLNNQSYTIMMMCTMVGTAICTPLVSVMYKPLDHQQCSFSKRTIRHLRRQSTELRILTCVHNQDQVPAIINLLEATYATEESPICVYVLRLVELVGRSISTLVDHKKTSGGFSSDNNMQLPDSLINAFLNYEQQHMMGHVVVQPFTAVAPYKTMHQDICSLANDKNVTLIIVPFRRKEAVGYDSEADLALRAMIPNILAHAPCSVGILIHHNNNNNNRIFHHSSGHFVHNVGVLFWSGPDDREALAYAFRMARNNDINLSIIRFQLPSHDDPGNDEERRLDDQLIAEFKIDNSSYDEHVVIEEVAVKDVEEAITMIKSIKDMYDLMIVGQRQGWSTLHNNGLIEWSECPELGVIGDMFASSDFGFTFPVLVVKQHH